MGRAKEKLTFANVISVTAAFIALGGTAVAVTQLPKDSVGARQIKRNAVRSAEVKNFSLRANDFAKGQLPAGERGEPGPPGATGAPGTPATRIYAFVRTGNCCGGGQAHLDPPQLVNAHGATSVEIDGTGHYVVSFDTSLLPGGDVASCVPVASLGSNDAASPLRGTLSFSKASGIPEDKIEVSFRDPTGAFAHLATGGGSDGFSIALFC